MELLIKLKGFTSVKVIVSLVSYELFDIQKYLIKNISEFIQCGIALENYYKHHTHLIHKSKITR